MTLLPMILEVLPQRITKGEFSVSTIADYLEDNFSSYAEVNSFISKLREPSKLTINNLLDIVAKFGTRKERSLIRKAVKKYLDNCKPRGRRSLRLGLRTHRLKSPYGLGIGRHLATIIRELLSASPKFNAGDMIGV